MVESVDEQVEDSKDFNYTTDDVKSWVEDKKIIEEVKKIFKRVTAEKAKDILWRLIRNQSFKASDVSNNYRTFVIHNWGLFDIPTGTLTSDKNIDFEIKPEEFRRIRKELLNAIQIISNQRQSFNDARDYTEDVDEHGRSIQIYHIKKNVTFELIRKRVCDELGQTTFMYDFDNPDITMYGTIHPNSLDLQRIHIQILSQGIKFEYPLMYRYRCSNCGNETVKKAYEVTDKGSLFACEHFYSYTTSSGEEKTRICKNLMRPDKEISTTMSADFYEIAYTKGEKKLVAAAFSFKEFKPGYYECVLYRIPSAGKTETFFIVDVKQVPPASLTLPEPVEDTNYLFSLQEAIDKYILEKTGVRIYGLYPIKCAMILQTMLRLFGERLLFNVMIVGDPSTGKSLLLKYYSYALNNYYNMSTNGLSVSVAGLRGTRSNISLFGKDIKIVTVGHLGTFYSIHIDEAGENPELVQNLKSFLLEDNYSYDRAGGLGISNRRTSHINVSQNLDYEHVGQYRGAIRKAYKDLNMTIGGVEKEEWDENWDLFLPLHLYDNPQLRKVIKEKRLEFKQKQVWWIDGLDYALHERFPFYFYLVNEKESEGLNAAVRENVIRKQITENLEVTRVLYTEDLEKFFMSLKEYQYSPEDGDACLKVDKIINQYGHKFDTRTRNIFYMIVRYSRIINKRMNYTNIDYDLVRWFLEVTNVKLDIADTDNYKIQGPPNVEGEQQRDMTEEDSKSINEQFGQLPPGEFDG